MDRRRGRLARWLGGPSARRRRHRRALALGIALLAVAGLLIVLGDDGGGDDGFDDAAGEVCAELGDRIQREYALSFPEGAPVTDAAAAEYLSRPFADTMDDLVARLRELDPPGDRAGLVDDLAERIEEVRATPEDFVRASPLAGIAERFDDAGLPACGSEFLAPPE